MALDDNLMEDCRMIDMPEDREVDTYRSRELIMQPILDVFDRYKEWQAASNRYQRGFFEESVDPRLITRDEILTPFQIKLLTRLLSKENSFWKSGEYANCSSVIDRLIQDSYNHGHNGFIIDNGNRKWLDLGFNLVGNKDEYLRLGIKGPLGYSCLGSMEYVDATIYGEIGGNTAFYSYSCRFEFFAETNEIEVGTNSNNCVFVHHKKMPFFVGMMGQGNIIKVMQTDDYKEMLHSPNCYHSLELIDENGKTLKSTMGNSVLGS